MLIITVPNGDSYQHFTATCVLKELCLGDSIIVTPRSQIVEDHFLLCRVERKLLKSGFAHQSCFFCTEPKEMKNNDK